jgi:hypothetical protein
MKIDFYMSHGELEFTDSIVLSEGQTMTPEEIEKIKQQRFSAWLAITEADQSEVK